MRSRRAQSRPETVVTSLYGSSQALLTRLSCRLTLDRIARLRRATPGKRSAGSQTAQLGGAPSPQAALVLPSLEHARAPEATYLAAEPGVAWRYSCKRTGIPSPWTPAGKPPGLAPQPSKPTWGSRERTAAQALRYGSALRRRGLICDADEQQPGTLASENRHMPTVATPSGHLRDPPEMMHSHAAAVSLGDLDESSKLSKTVVHMGHHGSGGLHYLGWGGGQTLQQNRTNTISSQQLNVYWQPTPEASKQIRSLLSLGVPRRVELRSSPARCTGRRGVVVLCWFYRPTWFSSSLAGACVGDNLSVLHWLTAKVPTARIMSTFDLAIGCQGPLPVRTWTQHVTRSTQEQCRRRRTHRTFTRSQAQAMWPDDSLALASTGPRQASRRPTPGSPPPRSIAIVLPSLTLLYSTMQYGLGLAANSPCPTESIRRVGSRCSACKIDRGLGKRMEQNASHASALLTYLRAIFAQLVDWIQEPVRTAARVSRDVLLLEAHPQDETVVTAHGIPKQGTTLVQSRRAAPARWLNPVAVMSRPRRHGAPNQWNGSNLHGMELMETPLASNSSVPRPGETDSLEALTEALSGNPREGTPQLPDGSVVGILGIAVGHFSPLLHASVSSSVNPGQGEDLFDWATASFVAEVCNCRTTARQVAIRPEGDLVEGLKIGASSPQRHARMQEAAVLL
ncbi:hypothetical protein ACCO45_013689 [Purpureocillium lilacinum]|uniref:Uncharacterized protein n=1 Tax=Purpureocillium lilacinum TaxID=33203 RepID=A0ACC4D798_PURLI